MKHEFTVNAVRLDINETNPMCFVSGRLINIIGLPCSGTIIIPLPISELQEVKGINGLNPIQLRVTVETI